MLKFRFGISFLVVLFCLTGCGSNPVDLVKKGTISLDMSITVEDALDRYDYFSSTSWTTFEDTQKRTIVEFRGVMDFDSYVNSTFAGIALSQEMISKARDTVTALIYIAQFAISKSDVTFSLRYSGLNILGTHMKTGEAVDKKMPDENRKMILAIYNNSPETTTWSALYSLSQ